MEETTSGALSEAKRLKKEKMKRRRAKNALKGKRGKKNMPQAMRLEKAKKWIAAYAGDNLLKAYRKQFATDRMVTLHELQLLGYEFSEDEIQREKDAVKAQQQHEKNKKAKRREKLLAAKELQNNPAAMFPDSDGTFFFIAGYTSGGAPYGTTWEEMGLEPFQRMEDCDF